MTHDENGVKSPTLRMTIAFDETTGQFGVQGIPPNKITALGMLKMAEHVVMGEQPVQRQKSPIVQPPPGMRVT